ncbi:peptidase inhibitor family I36 protein [Streptomyces sp. NPDC090106]|uniref:peptidase inhibitor family I36 protein n=1 Tax=Streptomyces sp. NPDC090106 TaxID=3365946 RepID=UPI003823CED4
MPSTRNIVTGIAAMAFCLTLSACGSQGSDSAGGGNEPSNISVKDGPDATALPESSVAPAVLVDDCALTEPVCLYTNVDHKGKIDLPEGDCFADLRLLFLGAANDAVSSAVNNSSEPIRLYESTNNGGRYIVIEPHSAQADLRAKIFTVFHGNGEIASNSGEFNDVTSSYCAVKPS